MASSGSAARITLTAALAVLAGVSPKPAERGYRAPLVGGADAAGMAAHDDGHAVHATDVEGVID
jgi:hypothetical protein